MTTTIMITVTKTQSGDVILICIAITPRPTPTLMYRIYTTAIPTTTERGSSTYVSIAQLSGSEAKSFLAVRYQRMPEIGRFQRPFISSRA